MSMNQSSGAIITVRAYVDGACRGNPGIGACAGIIEWPDEEAREFAHYEGEITTNIRMEIMAVLGAVIEVKKWLERRHQRAHLYIYSDCQNVVQCASGVYTTRANADLWSRWRALCANFPGTIAVQWIPREENHRADALVNTTLDEALEPV